VATLAKLFFRDFNFFFHKKAKVFNIPWRK
jgi:hypothetical protein